MKKPISERGFSLVEMMVSITIGLMILVALLGVLSGNAKSSKTNERTSELQSNGRYALNNLKRELRHAGYRGYTWADQTPPTTAIAVTYPAGSVEECGGAGNGFVQNIRQGVWGANDSNPFADDCINDGYLRGDVLVIRRVAAAPSTTLAAGTFYLRSTYSAGEVFQGTVAPVSFSGVPLAMFGIQEYVYYIGSDDNDTTFPALRRVSLQADGSMMDEMVVSGIEHLQVRYGIATTDLNQRYYDANNISGSYSDTNLTDWSNVNSVRIWLLARNQKVEAGYIDTNTYVMGDVTYGPTNDGYRRQIFSSVVQLRN